jgi:hypothetical protein
MLSNGSIAYITSKAKTAAGLLMMVESRTSKNGINTSANMGMSSTYQTAYNMLKKDKSSILIIII